MTLFAAGSRVFPIRNVKPFLPLLVFVAIAFLIAATYAYSFRQLEKLIQEEKLHDLGAIADMKANQIATWRDTQKRIGEAFACESAAAEFQAWLQEGAPANRRRQQLRQELAELQQVNGYKTLAMIDRRGAVRLALDSNVAIGAEEMQLAVEAMERRETVFSEFHRNSYGDRGISVDLIAPLVAGGRESGAVVGAVLLQIDPYTYLYPLVRSWPVHSASAETLLVRQQGNDVLYLNDVRHREGTALALRLPLDTPRLPAAMALRGKSTSTDGIDYRGMPVVSEMRQVAGAPWFVVSKVDREELFAPVTRLKRWSNGLGAAFAGFGGLLVFVWLQGYRARYRHLKEQHAAAVEREMLTKHFEYLTKYANDIILVADEDGGIVEANERAQQAYGYPREHLLRMSIRDLCDPSFDPNTCWRRTEQFNERGESRFETVNLRRDGSAFPVEVSARDIEMEGGWFSQFIIRDISERRRAEEILRKSETLLNESQQMAHIGSWELDLKNNVLYWTDENWRIFERVPGKFGASYEAFLETVHPDDRDLVNAAYTSSIRNRTPYTIVHRLQFPGGRVKYVREWGETYYDEDGQPSRSIGTTQDVTEQQLAISELKRTEELIGRNNHLLETLFSSIHVMIAYLDSDFNFVKVNNAYAAANRRIAEFFPGKNHFDLFPNEENEAIFRKAVETGETVIYFAKPFEHPELGVTYWDWRLQPIKGPDGRVEGLIFSLLDVTAQQRAQQELRASARQIEDLYNHAPCGYHSLDSGGVIVQINDTELEWLGYAREEVAGRMNFADLLAPASLEAFRRNFPGFKRRGYVHDLEYELVRKDGTTFFVSLSATAVTDVDGRYLASRSTLFDITARKRAEDELRLHGTILTQMEEGVILVRADAGTIVYVNPKLERMFGYAAGEMTGMHVSRINAATDRSPEQKAREIMAALHDQGKWSGEIVNLRKDGTPFWCYANVSTFQHHSYGTVWVSTHEDISERKLVEKRLAESEERFRTMADQAPIMIWMAGAAEQPGYRGCDFFNQRWHDFTGLPLERTQGRAWLDLVHPDDGRRCLDAYRRAFRAMKPFKLEYRLRRHDGVFRWVKDSGVPRFTAEGSFLGFIGTCLDITDHKLFEEIRAQVEHVGRLNIAGEMASGLAHELSQPLNAANNYLDACLRRMEGDNWDRDGLQKAVRHAYAQTERAGAIINHLKSLVRKQKQERSMVEVNALINDTLGFMDYELHHHAVRLSLDLTPVPPVLANRIEVEQVLINLIKNAIDSMDSSQRRELRIASRTVESGAVMVSVSDTGKGIAADELDKVFNPFQTSKKEGLGLGLPICRSVIENYGGQIWAEQNEHGGAEFNFTLPAWGGL